MAGCELPPTTDPRGSARAKYMDRYPTAYGKRPSQTEEPNQYVYVEPTRPMHRSISPTPNTDLRPAPGFQLATTSSFGFTAIHPTPHQSYTYLRISTMFATLPRDAIHT